MLCTQLLSVNRSSQIGTGEPEKPPPADKPRRHCSACRGSARISVRIVSPPPPACLPQLLPFFRSGTTPPGQMGVRPARAAIADRELQACPQHPAALHRRSKLPYLLLCKSRPAHPTGSLATVGISDRDGEKHSENHPPNHLKFFAGTATGDFLLRTVSLKYHT